MKTRHKDEWIGVSNVTERFDDQDLLGYQTLLTQNEKFQTKIRSGELLVNLSRSDESTTFGPDTCAGK